MCVVSVPEALAYSAHGILDPMTASLVDSETLYVLNKTDTSPVDEETLTYISTRLPSHPSHNRIVPVSVRLQQGLKDVSQLLLQVISERCALSASFQAAELI